MRSFAIALLFPAAAVLAAAVSGARAPLELSWRLKQDVFDAAGHGVSVCAFVLTNRGARPWPASGWAVYFTAVHDAVLPDSPSGLRLEHVTGSLQRITPGPRFAGLLPGESVELEYRTGLLANGSFAPNGVYAVTDDAPAEALEVAYTAAPFTRAPQPGADPHVVTADAQYELDQLVQDVSEEALPVVLPTPLSSERRDGTLRLDAMPDVVAPPELRSEAALARGYLEPLLASRRPKPAAARPGAASPVVRLELGPVEGQVSPEAYELLIDPGAGVRIVGHAPAGVFYGLQSLRGLLPVPAATAGGRSAASSRGAGVTLPALRLLDAPRFGYRGLMLDVARNFQPKAQVLRVLELMSRYKLNTLHFHLTDDEAWRLELPSLPELVAVGARRGHTPGSGDRLPPAFGSGGDVRNPYGSGYYTHADYVEILRYAAARQIRVIPELEMPGHARAAIQSMEARARALRAKGDPLADQYLLSDPEDRSVYTSAQGYHDNVMNPALPTTYAFIERAVADLAALHAEAGVPLRALHLGGDEVPEGAWQGSPAAAGFLKQQGLASVDELWYAFYARVEAIVRSHGLVPSGWEELGLRSTRLDGRRRMIPNPDFAARGWTAYVWNNSVGGGAEDLAYRMANAGYKVVLVPVSNNYLDLAWNKNPEERGLVWGGYVGLQKPYEFIPFDYYRSVRFDNRGNPVDPALFVGKDRLTDYGRSNILGIEGALWSETLGGDGRLDYMLVPKLFGVAERAWAAEPSWALEPDRAKADALFREAYSAFVSAVGRRELPRLDRETPPWRYRIPKPGLRVENGQLRASLEIPGFVLRYTLDGSEPTARSPEWRGPVAATDGLRVAAFDTNGRKGWTAAAAP